MKLYAIISLSLTALLLGTHAKPCPATWAQNIAQSRHAAVQNDTGTSQAAVSGNLDGRMLAAVQNNTGTSQAAVSGNLDGRMLAAGLIDVGKADTTLRVELMYSTSDNFAAQDMYGDLESAYLLPHFAKKVIRAQQLLRNRRPGCRLLICDAARPISVQRQMYSLVEGTPNQVYVANGNRGGRHNYGVAVDVTLLGADGKKLDMGTPVDFFGCEAHTGNEQSLVSAGTITKQAAANRALLIGVMREAGLVPYRREWWHFEEPMPMAEVRQKYKLLNF